MTDEYTQIRIKEQYRVGKAALIVVDVQNDFCHSEGAFGKRGIDLRCVEGPSDKLVRFIKKCRLCDLPIIFVRTIHDRWTDSDAWTGRLEGAGKEMLICRPDTWGAEFFKVKPLDTDFVVTKHRFSGFVGTDLDLVLRSRGIESLFMVGFTTNVCVETTARDGFNLGYRIILVEDCCAAFSPEEHASAITNINKYFGVAAGSDYLAALLKQ